MRLSKTLAANKDAESLQLVSTCHAGIIALSVAHAISAFSGAVNAVYLLREGRRVVMQPQ